MRFSDQDFKKKEPWTYIPTPHVVEKANTLLKDYPNVIATLDRLGKEIGEMAENMPLSDESMQLHRSARGVVELKYIVKDIADDKPMVTTGDVGTDRICFIAGPPQPEKLIVLRQTAAEEAVSAAMEWVENEQNALLSEKPDDRTEAEKFSEGFFPMLIELNKLVDVVQDDINKQREKYQAAWRGLAG